MAQPSQHEIKQELVDAIRMLEHAEYIDHNGHCSVRRDANSFYINSGASMRACLTVEDIVAVDLDGKPVDGGNVKPPLEFPIHAEVYRARPKVNAVFHTHPQWSTYLTMTGHPQKVVYAQASLLGDMPVMNSPMSVNTREMGEKMIAVMGDNPVVMLKAHGVVAAGETVLECFAYAAYVEENARRYMACRSAIPVFGDENRRRAGRLRSPSRSRRPGPYRSNFLGERFGSGCFALALNSSRGGSHNCCTLCEDLFATRKFPNKKRFFALSYRWNFPRQRNSRRDFHHTRRSTMSSRMASMRAARVGTIQPQQNKHTGTGRDWAPGGRACNSVGR
jgi:L-fuculose-phosphate aldolase